MRTRQESYSKFVNIRVKINDINNADIFNNNLSEHYVPGGYSSRNQPIEIHSASILYIKLEFFGGYSLNDTFFEVDTKRIQYKKDIGFYNVGGPELVEYGLVEEAESGFYKYNLSNMPGNITKLIYVILINNKK